MIRLFVGKWLAASFAPVGAGLNIPFGHEKNTKVKLSFGKIIIAMIAVTATTNSGSTSKSALQTVRTAGYSLCASGQSLCFMGYSTPHAGV